MKKVISTLLISAMIISTLTACGSTTSEPTSNNSTKNESTMSTVSDDVPTSSENGDSPAPVESGNETPADPNNSSDIEDPENPAPNEGDGADNSDLPFPENGAGTLAKTVLATNVWPRMDIVDSQEFIDSIFSSNFVLDSCEEFCFATNVISAQLYKVIIIKPKDGKKEDLSTAIDNYFDAVKNDPNLAFYPMQEESANGTVKGETGSGYLYLVVHENGAEIESAVLG